VVSKMAPVSIGPVTMRKIPLAIIEEAKRTPGGWVYEITGAFDTNAPVPPETIRGAWAVNHAGEIVGEFIPNPNYDPTRQPRS
jgi:hypothetical protein